MVGAFLAGAIIDARWFEHSMMDRLRHHVLLILIPVFFLSTGLRTQWHLQQGPEVLLVFAAAAWLLFASITGKLVGVHLTRHILGWQQGEARLVGWLLQNKALITIIFANVLLEKAVITASTFTVPLLMAVSGTMLTVPVVTPMLKRWTTASEAQSGKQKRPPECNCSA